MCFCLSGINAARESHASELMAVDCRWSSETHTHTHTQRPPKTRHPRLLRLITHSWGVFGLASPWQRQMPPRQDCYLNPSSSAGVRRLSSKHTMRREEGGGGALGLRRVLAVEEPFWTEKTLWRSLFEPVLMFNVIKPCESGGVMEYV